MKGNIIVPYKENDVNGIIQKIVKITKSKNIYRDGFISFYSSSIYSDTCFDVLTGTKDYTAKYTWFTTKGDDPDPWLTIDFHSNKLAIEGFVIYTDTSDYLPKYEVFVSNDNASWEKIGEKTFTSEPKEKTQSFKTTKREARFINLHGIGQRFGGHNLRMAIYQIDLFGKLSGISLFRQSCHVRRRGYILDLILIEMITLS